MDSLDALEGLRSGREVKVNTLVLGFDDVALTS
jgi:hypothetical protein